MRRVVVTGLGAVTPIGLNTDDFWDAIKKNTLLLIHQDIKHILQLK